jgi:mannan endo-1,6-alpha-mannosidase
MTFTSSLITAVLVSASLPLAACLQLDTNNGVSIKTASADLAFGLMSWYHNNATGVASTAVGVFPQPLYWWEAGAVWGAMIDNWAYTGDRSYIPTITQGLLAQTGPDNNFMPPAYFSSLGNDDQAFWALASLSALEYNFPTPEGKASTIWLDLSRAVFDSMVPRWDTTSCNGGLRWQIFPANAGYDYKNVSRRHVSVLMRTRPIDSIYRRSAMRHSSKLPLDWLAILATPPTSTGRKKPGTG